jgi:hypothetical protein
VIKEPTLLVPDLHCFNFSSRVRLEVKLTFKMAAYDPLPGTTTQEQFQPPPKFDAEGVAERGIPTEGCSDITLEGKIEDVCADCERVHLPQRLVICHDGTWMLPDGAIGK